MYICNCMRLHQHFKRAYIKAPPAGRCCLQLNSATLSAVGDVNCQLISLTALVILLAMHVKFINGKQHTYAMTTWYSSLHMGLIT